MYFQVVLYAHDCSCAWPMQLIKFNNFKSRLRMRAQIVKSRFREREYFSTIYTPLYCTVLYVVVYSIRSRASLLGSKTKDV